MRSCNRSHVAIILQKISNQIAIKALLSYLIKRLFQKREYLKIYISNLVFLKVYHHLLEK